MCVIIHSLLIKFMRAKNVQNIQNKDLKNIRSKKTYEGKHLTT